MSDVTEMRRRALREAVEKIGGVSKASKLLGYTNPSFLSQMIGPNPTREITEKTARKFEEKLHLAPGTLDGTTPAPGPVATGDATADLVAAVIRMVGTACNAEGVQPQVDKFSEVVALAYIDAVRNGGEPRETHARQLARLLK